MSTPKPPPPTAFIAGLSFTDSWLFATNATPYASAIRWPYNEPLAT